ncbi:MAG: hypothetical protein HKN20_09940, partial [Gemmatimonadetes bacterium]|nr:hypothetical protein [Gemmatimonadota bacterium]
VSSIPLVVSLEARGDRRVLYRDAGGEWRFHADFANADDLASALDAMQSEEEHREAVMRDRASILDLYESVFSHHSYTGRSGTMYGYEGIGSIYWHMVAKLLLAIQETALRAMRGEEDEAVVRELVSRYYRVREGLGFEKTPEVYGAFPTDPYSHSPGHAGARQPGMTGQVKEEILTRFGELGVAVYNGCLHLEPMLLRSEEYRSDPGTFAYYDCRGRQESIDIPARSLAFTVCQVPVVYHRVSVSGEPWIRVTDGKGADIEVAGSRLGRKPSRSLFARRGDIARIDAGIVPSPYV